MKTHQNIIGIVLAAGKGTRFKSNGTNKTVSLFRNKPLVQFGIDLYKSFCSNIVVVVGAYSESVISAISHNDNLIFAFQRKRLGTGHALNTALLEIKKSNLHPKLVLLGYGDHMMYYTKDIVEKLVDAHTQPETMISVITTMCDDPTGLGRVIRNKRNTIEQIVEQKDATPKQLKINEANAGFYCFNYDFLQKNSKKIKKSPVTGEYYINDFLNLAVAQGKIVQAVTVPFENVGFGINTRDDLDKNKSLYTSLHQ